MFFSPSLQIVPDIISQFTDMLLLFMVLWMTGPISKHYFVDEFY